jgi:hypothetical protein
MKRLTTTLLVLITNLAVTEITASPAKAQWVGQWKNPYTGRTFNNPMSSSLDTMIMHSMQQSMQKRMMYRVMLRKKGYSDSQINQLMTRSEPEIMVAISGRKGAISKSEPKTSNAKLVPAINAVPATRFKPSGKRLLLDAFVNDMGKTKEQREALRKIFAGVFQAYEPVADKAGFSNDVAGALSFFIAMHYSAYNDGATVSDADTVAIARQLRAALDGKEMRKASNIDKQKMYETYVMLGGFTLALSQSAATGKDDDLLKLRKQMGEDGLKSLLKVEPSRVKITDQGLEIVSA